MTFDAISSLLLIPATLALVSALRKLAPAIDGKLAVFICASAVGVGLSFAARYVLPGEDLAPWLVAVRGATVAAVAFGVASWPRWAADVLHTALANAAATGAEVAASPQVDVKLPEAKL